MPISNSNPDFKKATQQQDFISNTFHKSRKDTSLLVLCSRSANQSTLNLRQLMLVDCIQLAISHPISVDDHLLWQSLLLLVECTQAGWKCPTQLATSPATKYYIHLKQPRNVRGYTFTIFFFFSFPLVHTVMRQKWCRTDWSLHHQLLKSDQAIGTGQYHKEWLMILL